MSLAKFSRFLVSVFVSFFVSGNSASAMVFLAPDASTKEFAQHLSIRNQLSYTEWMLKKEAPVPGDLEPQSEVRPKVSEFVEKSLQRSFSDEPEMLLAWENLRTSEDLRSVDRELLSLLAEKLGNTEELCRLLLLEPPLVKKLEQPERAGACVKIKKPLPKEFLQTLDRSDVVSIDGKLFAYDSVPQHLVPGKYRWKVLSNRFVDREFVESLDNAKASLMAGTPWVEGSCNNAKVTHADFAVLAQASIYFNDQCIPAGLPVAPESKSWVSPKNSWLWGVGILLVGATAYSLRDKELIITKP